MTTWRLGLRWVLTAAVVLGSLFGSLLGLGVSPALAAPDQAPVPGRWIDVDLVSRVATAYEGDTPVYRAPVTSGKPGYSTSTGTFYIFSRVSNETMNSETLGVPRTAAEGYYLKDVMYTQYFEGDGTAIHGNYWSPDWVFGRADVSHGCVGMRNSDAAFFWSFAGYGTPVVVRRAGDTSGVAVGGPVNGASPSNPASQTVTVESVVGKPLADAKAKLEAAGLKIESAEDWSKDVPAGAVVSQQPAGGATANRGSAVKLIVSKGSPAPKVGPVKQAESSQAWVPEVVGLPESEARARIEQAGLVNSYTNLQTENDVPEAQRSYFRAFAPGSVVSVSLPAGQQVPRGTVVQIAVRKQ